MILKFTFNFDILIFAKIYAEITYLLKRWHFLVKNCKKEYLVQQQKFKFVLFNIQIRVVQGFAILQKKYQIKSAVVFSSEVQNADRQHFSHHHIFGTGSGPVGGQSESTASLEIFIFFSHRI